MKGVDSMKKDLSRFTDAQKTSYEIALKEIKNGRKTSHWMWYIFPQISGLGRSSTAQYYAIKNLDEAKEYLKDDYLGNNLREISKALLNLETNNAQQIFGNIDSKKLKSSMTLFGEAGEDSIFQKVLDKFFDGKKDMRTIKILEMEK